MAALLKKIHIDLVELKKFYNKGATIWDLVELYDCSYITVYRALMKAEVKMRKTGTQPRKYARNEQIRAERLVLGRSYKDIARDHNLTRQRIEQIINPKEEPHGPERSGSTETGNGNIGDCNPFN